MVGETCRSELSLFGSHAAPDVSEGFVRAKFVKQPARGARVARFPSQ